MSLGGVMGSALVHRQHERSFGLLDVRVSCCLAAAATSARHGTPFPQPGPSKQVDCGAQLCRSNSCPMLAQPASALLPSPQLPQVQAPHD